MQLELFSGECKLCERTEVIVRSIAPDIPLQVHRSSECVDGSCCRLAESYGVRAVPTLVADGKIIYVGLPEADELRQILNTLLTSSR